MNRSPDADAILNHPFSHHAKLQNVSARLANDPQMSLASAEKILAIAANDLGLTQLDIEAVQPDDAVDIPFDPNAGATQKTQYESSVADHRERLKEVRGI